MSLIVSAWHNGTKALFISFAVFLAGAVMFIGAALITLTRGEEFNPLRYPLPQEIIGSRVLHPGDGFEVVAQKCNDGDEAVGVVGMSDWREVLPDGSFGPGQPYRASTSTLFIEGHTCIERRGINQIPLDLATEKNYRLEGLDCIVPEKRLCRPWWTQTFDVVRVPD